MGNMGKMVVVQGLERSFPAQHPRVSRPTAALGAGAGRCGAASGAAAAAGAFPSERSAGRRPRLMVMTGGRFMAL